MIRQMFVFGVLIPTVITILVFIGFLICWFKFNIRERVLKSQFYKKHFRKGTPQENMEVVDNTVVFSREGSSHWPDPGEPSGGRPDADQTLGSRDRQTQLLPSNMADDTLSVCSVDDSTSLCKAPPSESQKSKTSVPNYILNPNWRHFGKHEHMASDPPINIPQSNGTVQMTYNFPELDRDKSKRPDDVPWSFAAVRQLKTQDSEYDNYGHFVMPDEAVNVSELDKFEKPMVTSPKLSNEANHRPCSTDLTRAKEQSRFPLKYHQSVRKSDPLHGPGFHYVTSVQDCNISAPKYRFPAERAPALLTGI